MCSLYWAMTKEQSQLYKDYTSLEFSGGTREQRGAETITKQSRENQHRVK